jgi:hypothetical protein
MKLYTISLQNHNKKNSPVNFGASSLNSFTGTLLHEFRKALILLLLLFFFFFFSFLSADHELVHGRSQELLDRISIDICF